MKLRYDTKDFGDLPLIKNHFNAQVSGTADPFLVQMSLGGKVIAGADIRRLRKAKDKNGKRVLAWAPDELQKAKSCDEMLQFEKYDPRADKSWKPYQHTPPDTKIVTEFAKYLQSLCSKINSKPSSPSVHAASQDLPGCQDVAATRTIDNLQSTQKVDAQLNIAQQASEVLHDTMKEDLKSNIM